jgi:hypothetical protein
MAIYKLTGTFELAKWPPNDKAGSIKALLFPDKFSYCITILPANWLAQKIAISESFMQ